MGSCINPKKRVIFLQNFAKISDPSVFIVENFKIIDHTGRLKDIIDISEVKDYFHDYKATDFRCIKGTRESKHDHSHLVIAFNRMAHNQIIDELSLITNYSPYGFAINIGDLNTITNDCNLKSANIELIHLPKADSELKV